MYCRNNYAKFLAEMITVSHDQIILRDINKVIESLTNENLLH